MTNQSAASNKPDSIPAQKQDQQPGIEGQMSPKPEVIRANYKGSDKLLNKVALITGGDSGIGRSVAVHFAREGADVVIVYKNENEDAQETKEMVEKEGRRCILIAGDIGREDFCQEIVRQTVASFGKLNIVVNNAAEQHPKDSIEEIITEDLESTFRTNILSMFHIVKAAMPHMQSGDSIINTTSVTAYRGSEHLLDYSSTKGAINSFTRSLAKNLAEKNIRVNAVAPGPIWTPLIPATFSAEQVAEFGQDVPLGRPGQPSEVGPSFVFLASEDASYMTGQILHPNGGEVVNA
jgi:NAD(P)-dependent dehydrogenase (short-subunit alcohol dehydrogenase family)